MLACGLRTVEARRRRGPSFPATRPRGRRARALPVRTGQAILAAGDAATGRVLAPRRRPVVGYVERHLLANERVIYKTRLHWILFARPVLVTALMLVLTIALGAVTHLEWIWYVSLLVILVGCA